jgi:hypothetical protein
VTNQTDNPYQNLVIDDPPAPATAEAWQLADLLRCFALWLVVCGISAIPSFIWGHNLAEHPLKFPAMLLGVAAFAIAYTLVDSRLLRAALSNNLLLKRAAFIGFGIRLTVSAIFPLGMMVDLVPGMLSVMIVQATRWHASGPELGQIGTIVATTLVQGVLLNVVLWSGILVIYCVLLLIPSRRREL